MTFAKRTFYWVALLFFALALFATGCTDPEEADSVVLCDTCLTDDDDDAAADDDDDAADDDDDTIDSETYLVGSNNLTGLGLFSVETTEGWTTERLPDIETGFGANINNIALNAADKGFATTGNERGSILQSLGGAWFNVTANPNSSGWFFTGLAVPTETFGVAVGYTTEIMSNQDPTGAFLLEYGGSDWSVATLGGTEMMLNDAAAIADGTAWAVGEDDLGDPIILSNLNKAWGADTFTGFTDDINAIVAVDGPLAWAVGDNEGSYLEFDGINWSAESFGFPVKAPAPIEWTAIDAASSTAIAAVGDNMVRGYIAVYDGSWTLHAPVLAYAIWELTDVTVIAADDIYATGYSSSDAVGIVLYWDGLTWEELTIPNDLENAQFGAVDFFDTDNGFLGGLNDFSAFMAPFNITDKDFGTVALPEIPSRYFLADVAVYDGVAYAAGELDASGEGVIVEWDGDSFTAEVIANSAAFTGIAAGGFGFYAVSADFTDSLYERDSGGTWAPISLGAAEFVAVAADDTRAVAVGAEAFSPAVYVNTGDGFVAETLPASAAADDVVLTSVALAGTDHIWVVGVGEPIVKGDEAGVVYHYDGTEWTVVDVDPGVSFGFYSVAAFMDDDTDQTYLGGYQMADTQMIPLLYEISFGGDPAEVDVAGTSTDDWWMADLAAYDIRGRGLAISEADDGKQSGFVVKRGGSSWLNVPTSGVPPLIQPGGIFYLENEEEATEE
jgi:hypothetical protein